MTVVHRSNVGIRGIRDIFADSSNDMGEAVMEELKKGYDIYMSAAAISDFTVVPAKDKISSKGPVTMELKPAKKILDRVRHEFPSLFIVAFKAETADDKEMVRRAMDMMDRAHLNMVIANRFGGVRDADRNDAYIIKADGTADHVADKKSIVASYIMDAITEYFI